MTQISPQDRFDTLLSALKKPPKGHNYLKDIPFIEPAEAFSDKYSKLNPIQIKIMESGIFYDGGLKGLYYQHGTHYVSYPIQDLAQFIFGLNWLLHKHEMGGTPGWSSTCQTDLFPKALRHLELFMEGVRIFKGKRAAQKFETILRTLKNLEKEVSAKPDSPPRVSRAALKQEVADIFHRHIQAPNAKEAMATRSADLLMAFNISATKEGMRDHFKNK